QIDLPSGEGLPSDTQLCFLGSVVPPDALYLPSKRDQKRWLSGLYLSDEYRSSILSAGTAPTEYTLVVTTGRTENETEQISALLKQAFTEPALLWGELPEYLELEATHFDPAESTRQAAQGIGVVYGIIGWGVMLLGALGLLVATLISVRNRLWFFGLARAVGARTRQIATLVVSDVALVVVLGTALAITTLACLAGVIDDFAWQSFQVHANITNQSVISQALLGQTVVLLIACAYPSYRAVHMDPIDVLETTRT
ncbi:MAG: ABC transporter permease, partial [Bifidobacteriaceae bacterium]|nr:ABC transporter permease [Bifidobacteriaceae bacterium]